MKNDAVVERASFFGLLAEEGILPFPRTLPPRDRPLAHVVRSQDPEPTVHDRVEHLIGVLAGAIPFSTAAVANSLSNSVMGLRLDRVRSP
jgi:hypothetical protein